MDFSQAVSEAKKVIAVHVGLLYPEDDWFTISPDWDLNLFRANIEGVDYMGATLYKVVDGQTKTNIGYHVEVGEGI
jgi:hypothetical protein